MNTSRKNANGILRHYHLPPRTSDLFEPDCIEKASRLVIFSGTDDRQAIAVEGFESGGLTVTW